MNHEHDAAGAPPSGAVPSLTLQQIFDKVLAHLRKQAVRSSETLASGGAMCCYRDPQGRMCAAGCLIPDNAYVPAMEARTAGPDLAQYAHAILAEGYTDLALGLIAGGVDVQDNDTMSLVRKLQMAHDSHMPDAAGATPARSAERWEAAMKRIARDFVLAYTEPAKEVYLRHPDGFFPLDGSEAQYCLVVSYGKVYSQVVGTGQRRPIPQYSPRMVDVAVLFGHWVKFDAKELAAC